MQTVNRKDAGTVVSIETTALSGPGNLGPRVHISRSACVNDLMAVGLPCGRVTHLYNVNTTATERGPIIFRGPARLIDGLCFNMQIKMQIIRLPCTRDASPRTFHPCSSPDLNPTNRHPSRWNSFRRVTRWIFCKMFSSISCRRVEHSSGGVCCFF